MESIPPEALLADYPEPMRAIAEGLRRVVLRALPGAVERVRSGWRIIGYDVPNGRRWTYFAFVMPERGHVHLGFHYGVFMDDPAAVLQGEGEVRRARWVTFEPGDDLDEERLAALVREGARVALLSRPERFAGLLDREARPVGLVAGDR